MYKRIDLTQLGGFPATQYTLDYLQDGYNAIFGALAALIGDKVILAGMEVVGGQTTNGYVSIAGEILPFVGGPTIATLVVVETNESRVFEDDHSGQVYFKRVAQFGAGAGSINVSDMVRVGTMKNMFYGMCPVGSVIPYEGDMDAIPTGWQLHELIKGKVLVGLNAADADFNLLGKTGGEKKHTLVTSELPAMALRLKTPTGGFYYNDTGGGGGNISLKGDNDNSAGNGVIVTETIGGGLSHNILQPYYVIGFIKRIA